MFESLEAPTPEIPLDLVAAMTAEHFQLAGSIEWLGGERDLNARIDTGEQAYAVKVTDPATDEIPAVVAALRHIEVVDPHLPVPRALDTVGGGPSATFDYGGTGFRLSAFTYLPGQPLPPGPIGQAEARAVGSMLGRLQTALRGFIHPGVVRRLPWDARTAGELVPWAASIKDVNLRPVVEAVLSCAPTIAARLRSLPAQVIHHDFNRDNLLADAADPSVITGVVDFGDMIHGSRIQDLAVATAYATLDHPDPIESAAALVGGFLEHAEVGEDELGLLRELVVLRLAQSLAISAHRSSTHPENAEYILTDAESAAATLNVWLSLDPAVVDPRLGGAAGLIAAAPTTDLTQRRAASLWTGLRMAYSPPLHLVRGDGVWLEDASGKQYLDAYNNVPQVGHGNRRVIAAATAQAKRLNTNTRYLTDPAVTLAESITGRLPEPLSVCLLVNSGSEATDLAWRIARTVTGHTGAITTDHAYHGWTDAIYAISPEERPDAERPPWHTTMAPPHRAGAGAGAEDALHSLTATGHEPAAIWLDTTFSSDGIADPTASYLDDAVAAVRASGGLFIADEVQAGLGRVGSRYWGFAAGTAIPDVVTLGKPLGNGYPIGAVITTAEIAARFAERGYFFSTFGGNPVAAAAALMVLRITDELELPRRADAVGDVLRHELPSVLRPLGAEVSARGAGSFVGIELSDAAAAHAFVEAMRDEGVLVGRTGPGNTVVKIRPPLVFGPDHAERLIEAAAAAVRSIDG